MKKIICLCLFIFLCNACSTTKVVLKYNSDENIIKEYEILENKKTKVSYSNLFPCFQGCLKTDTSLIAYFLAVVPVAFDLVIAPIQIILDTIPKTSYTYTTYAKIEGKLINKNRLPVKNQAIVIEQTDNLNKTTETNLSTNNEGVFATELKSTNTYKEKQNDFNPSFTFSFGGNKNLYELNTKLQSGIDVNILNPIKINYNYPFKNAEKTNFYFDNNDIKEKKYKTKRETDIILLTNTECSAKYYRDKKREEEEREMKEQEKKKKELFALAQKMKKWKDISKYSEKDIKEAFEVHFNAIGVYNQYLSNKAIMNIEKNTNVYYQPIQILQILPNKGILGTIVSRSFWLDSGLFVKTKPYIVYIEYKNTKNFIDEQFIAIYAKIIGTFSYQNTFGGTRTVPKLKAYFIKEMQSYY